VLQRDEAVVEVQLAATDSKKFVIPAKAGIHVALPLSTQDQDG
jgi:hypothetical protein